MKTIKKGDILKKEGCYDMEVLRVEGDNVYVVYRPEMFKVLTKKMVQAILDNSNPLDN